MKAENRRLQGSDPFRPKVLPLAHLGDPMQSRTASCRVNYFPPLLMIIPFTASRDSSLSLVVGIVFAWLLRTPPEER